MKYVLKIIFLIYDSVSMLSNIMILYAVHWGIEKDADSSDEESEDEGHSSELNESDISGVESLHLVEQVFVFWTSRAGVLFVSFHSNGAVFAIYFTQLFIADLKEIFNRWDEVFLICLKSCLMRKCC